MADNLDIVGTAAVDIVPITAGFHDKLKAAVLPAADRVGEDIGRRLGEAISRHIVVDIPDAVTAGGRRARASATREGGQVGGAFGRAVQRKLEEAFRSLPRANVRLGDTGLNADLDRLRARIQTLSGKTIGVDIDAGAALAEITDIDARLERLAAQNPSVQIRTDTAAARAALAEVQRQINDVDRDDVHIRVKADTAGAMSALRALGIALGAVAALPVIPVAAAGIGSIASAAVAAGAGVGALALVAVPAIRSVTSVMQAKTAADQQAARATDNSAASNVKAAQQALQMASAQQALTAAHRQAAESIAQANRRVEDAERALGQAAARAMDQRRQAAEGVQRAERSLSDAQRQARQAQEDLTAARKTAAQQLDDLNNKLADGALNQREAALRVTEAADELNRVKAAHDAGTATDTDLARAQLSYDQAVQAQKEQSKSYKQLKDDAKKARKEGVDGNDDVKRAAERLRDAQRNVQDQTTAVADAQRAAARAQVEAAQSVADAQRNLSDAVANVADTQVQAADSIASAERGVESARLSSIDTTAKSVTATDTYRAALAKLTPEQRKLFDAIAGPKGLKAAFSDWSKTMSPDVVPLLTRAVNGAKGALPGLTPLVKAAADAVGVLFDDASRELKTPFWRGFKKDIDKSAKPAIVGFGRTFGNVIKGAAGVIDAFLPHIDSITDRMVRSSGKFANWGTKLKGSPQFEAFLKYASDKGPLIARTIGDIAGAFLAVGSALSPISGPLLQAIGALASGIASVVNTMPWLVQLAYGAYVAFKLWTIATAAFNLVMAANPIVLVGLAIVALVAAVIYAYQHFDWFRNGVQTAWSWIATSTTWLWQKILQPFFQSLSTIFVWIWKHIIKPQVGFIVSAFRGLADVVTWLWSSVFSPIFGFIGDLIVWWWRNIVRKHFHWVMDLVASVGNSFKWLYKSAIKPQIEAIGDSVSGVYREYIKPAFKNIRSGVDLVADSFEAGKKRIKSAWKEIASITAAPVNWVVSNVYTNGLKALWDRVAKFVHMDPLPKAPKLLDPPEKFATGGRTRGGIPGVDSIPILAMQDEFIIRRDSARKIGFDNLAYMNATGEIPRFANGGLVGGVLDWGRDKLNKGLDWAKTGADLLAHPGKVWDKLVKKLLSRVADGVGSSPWGDVLAKFPAKMSDGLRDAIVDGITGGGGGGDIGGTVPKGKRRSIISQAMAAAHVPPPGTEAQWLAGMNTLITRESAWNPKAINRTDINARNGVPSQGLAQVIPPTFRANHVPGTSWNILDPVANVAASIRYITRRYGNITNVQQANSHLPPKGYALGGRVVPTWYDEGGYLPKGLSLVANGTGRPEPVFTSQQWDDLRGAKGGTPNILVDAPTTVIIDGNEVRGIVDQQIAVRDADTGRAIDAGRFI
ncbi:transglycosylase SLT domain-containing protein [Streptomyces collinus]|uniref:transglycosylase SLT domain-containing protein n=1 Tax=Streptomyces collinus TaxID=42684 RepID=UPI0036A0B3AC